MIVYKQTRKNEKAQNFPKHCRTNFVLIDTEHFLHLYSEDLHRIARSHNLSLHNQFLSRFGTKSELKNTLDIKLTTALELRVIRYAYMF